MLVGFSVPNKLWFLWFSGVVLNTNWQLALCSHVTEGPASGSDLTIKQINVNFSVEVFL